MNCQYIAISSDDPLTVTSPRPLKDDSDEAVKPHEFDAYCRTHDVPNIPCLCGPEAKTQQLETQGVGWDVQVPMDPDSVFYQMVIFMCPHCRIMSELFYLDHSHD